MINSGSRAKRPDLCGYRHTRYQYTIAVDFMRTLIAMTAAAITSRLKYQTTLLTVNRTILNTNFRMVYPLLPVFARGVGVALADIAILLTLAQLIGLLAPVAGEMAERRSKRFNMLLGMALSMFGLTAVFWIPGYVGLGAALLMGAAGKVALYDPATQAYIGDRIPYEKRGLIMGLMELSWSAAYLIGVPAMAYLIDVFDWRAPFAVLAALNGLGLVGVFVLIDTDEGFARSTGPLLKNIRSALNSRTAVAGLVLGFGISSANQLIAVVFGTWIEVSFGVALAALAAASAVIGGSELLGEGLVAGLADRIGKQRVVAAGILVNIVACFLLPLATFSLPVALVVLFIFFLGFEVALVGTLPLASELTPTTRGMYMTLLVSSFTVGRALVTQPGVWLFDAAGIGGNCMAAVILNGVALVAVLWGIDLHTTRQQAKAKL
jgi:DHA1 family inner membrane transport protein